jgi:pyridoxine 5-phosphate synthase
VSDIVTTSKILLGVNVDHVATLRQARGTRYPDPVMAASAAERSGADNITVHLREDRRHIQERDLQLMSKTLQTRMNLEMAVAAPIVAIARDLRPADCCLVPERRAELTTEGGLDVAADVARIRDVARELGSAGIRVALFVDPDPRQLAAARESGVGVVELHTGRYADAADEAARAREFERIRSAAEHAARLGLEVHAGHGLNYQNVVSIAAIPEIVELNIGHAIIARALFDGMGRAVRDMHRLMAHARLA